MDLAAAFENEQKRAFRRSSSVKQEKPVEQAVWGRNDPKKYYETYGRLKPMKGENPLHAAFANGPASHNRPLITRQSVEIFPGMYSFDKPVLEFQRWLSNELNRQFEVDLDDEKFSRTGIHAGFDTLRCPAGYFQNPMSYTTVDNTLYRKELGLVDTYTDRQEQIAKEFWHLIFSEAKMAPVNVSKLSTGGMRRFTSSAQWKLDYANFVTQPENLEVILNAVKNKDWATLANDFEMLFATYIQKRGQVDSVGKVRTVFDLEYAVSGGHKGKAFPADKSVVLNGVEYTDFAGMRARVVHAGPWTANCVLQVPATVTMQSMFERFPKTFHINTAEQIKAVVDGNYLFCSDVTEFDRSMSRRAISLVHDVMKEYWDERLVDMSWRLFTSPYYAKPLSIDGKRGQWVRDPTDWTQEVFAGNRSGHAFTSLIAKGNKVIESLFIIDKIYPVLGRIKKFLNHEMPIKLVNNGDDEIVVASMKNDLDTFKKYRADLSSGHYVVKPEDGNGFSGMLLLKTDVPLVYAPTSRIHTSLQKWLTPEHSIGGNHRKYWPIGMLDRVENLTATEVGREAWSITMHGYRKFLQGPYGDFREVLTHAVSNMDINIDGHNAIDRDVLVNNDRIHYKYLDHEVSAEVMDKISAKIPVERVTTLCNLLFKGHMR